MKYLAIFLIMVGFVGTAFALPPFDSQEIFDFSDTIVVGQIIYVDTTFSPNKSIYHIQVEKFLKNPQNSEIIMAAGPNVESPRSGNQIFHVNDRGLFFLTNSTVGYDVSSGTLWVHPVSKLVEPEWNRCNIFENDIPQNHWVLGGVGPTPKISQEGNSNTENIRNNKMVTISYDVSNISDATKEIELGGILSRSNGTAFEAMSSMNQHVVLEPCTTYKTIEWRFTPGMTGSYLFEITSDTGTSYGIGFTVKDYPDPPLKQFMSGIVIEEIECKGNFVKVIKSSDGSLACVKQETREKLMDRGWTTDTTFYGLTKSQITDIQLAKMGCKKIGNQTYCNEMIQDKIEYYLQQNDLGAKSEPEPEPMPKPETDAEMQLYNAKKSLQNAYQNHINLGPYYMKDVIVGFGTNHDVLVIDIASKYTDSESIKIVKEEIHHIVGNDIKVNYVVYDEPIGRHIETVIPYLWNKILHQKKIEYAPKEQNYWNNADGFAEHDRVCSPLVSPNGTEFYISTTFDLEPFEITGTFIDKTRPVDCHKIWKTDVIMTEPDRVTSLWLENEN